jgi:cytosine/adenosine deaminase-related metal-dependent hydrolase
MSDCGNVTPVEQLDRLGMLSERFLAVHANYISENDVALLGKRGCSIVHCPRSHTYFGHKKFPWQMLANAGVNVCLGTDSLASVVKKKQPVELSLFAEMKEFAKNNPEVSGEIILQMATMNGARALGLKNQIGKLSPNTYADMVALPFSGKISEACDAVTQHEGDVSASMINGAWGILPMGK